VQSSFTGGIDYIVIALGSYDPGTDPDAEQWFENPPCDLCNASGWTVQTNSLWK